MIARDIRVTTSGDGWALTAIVDAETPRRQAFPLELRLEQGERGWLSSRGDAFVAMLLLPAMASGEDLVVEAPVSPRLLDRAAVLMDIYRAWKPDAARIRVEAPTAAPPVAASTSALFFSCGVDSFYSLIKNMESEPAGGRDEVSRLVIVHGFDVKLANPLLFEKNLAAARRVAADAGKALTVVRTNLRSFSDPITSWDLYHGGALAGVAFALSPLFSRCLVASTHSYNELVPWGSHPLLDRLWSTEALEFVHDGCEASRTEKIKRLSSNGLALSTLRVCWNNDDTEYNCGRCEKCVRTMIGLHIAGALERAQTFGRPLTSSAVRRLELATGESSLRFMEDLLQALGDSAADRRLAAALRHVIRRARWRARLGSTARRYFGPHAILATVRSRGLRAIGRRPARSRQETP